MAIAYVASADGGNAIAATSLTFSYTVAGDLLVVGVEGDKNSDFISGVTYNTVAMTQAAKRAANGTFTRWLYLYYLIGPATGAHNVVISASSSCDFILGLAADYSGVKATGQPDATATNNNGTTVSTLASSITTVADNAWAVLLESGYNGDAPSAGAGATFRVTDAAFQTIGLFDSGGVITPAGSYSMTTNRSSPSSGLSHVIAAFAPTVAAGGFIAGQRVISQAVNRAAIW